MAGIEKGKNMKLYQVTCCGRGYLSNYTNNNVYVVAENETEASTKALAKMRELKYDKCADYVSDVKLIACEKEVNKVILIL